jgi:hypothetical protein
VSPGETHLVHHAVLPESGEGPHPRAAALARVAVVLLGQAEAL